MRNSIFQGLGPQPLQGPGSGSGLNVAYPVEEYLTPLLDLTQTYSNIEVIPARPGYFPIIGSTIGIVELRTGTQTTPPTFKVGNNVDHTNVIASISTVPANANVNATVPPSRVTMLGTFFPNATNLINAATFFDLTSPAVGTGDYRCLIRICFTVWWAASGD